MSDNTTSTQDENDETVVEETQETVVDETTEDESSEEEVVEDETEEVEEESQPSRRDERIQDLVETNKMLRQLLETRTFRQPAQEETDLPAFEDAEVEKAFNAKLNKSRQQMQGQVGALAEELDATRFDRVLAKEGIDEDSPVYQKITTALQTYREEQAAQGHYFKRADAYAILKAKGLLKTSPTKSVKKVTVVKKKPKVGIERSTSRDTKSTKGKSDFKQLSLQDKEKALENVKF